MPIPPLQPPRPSRDDDPLAGRRGLIGGSRGWTLPSVRTTAASEPDAAVVVLCDDLFRTAIGAPCGGEAEERLTLLRGRELADRFEAAPGRWVSVYLPD